MSDQGQEDQSASAPAPRDLTAVAAQLADVGRALYLCGWARGTSGNFSAVVRRRPLYLAISASNLDKGALAADQILCVNAAGTVVAGRGKPSDETKLHLAVVETREGAGAVLHTHSVWGTILSESHAHRGSIDLQGYEMLKGLAGVQTHAHLERLPILDNSQDMDALAGMLAETLRRSPEAHGVLLRGHGLYTWGKDLAEAKRHVEIFEFLLEVVGRSKGMTAP